MILLETEWLKPIPNPVYNELNIDFIQENEATIKNRNTW